MRGELISGNGRPRDFQVAAVVEARFDSRVCEILLMSRDINWVLFCRRELCECGYGVLGLSILLYFNYKM